MARKKTAKKPRRHLPPDRPCGNTITGGTLVQSLHFDKKKHVPGKPRWTPERTTRWARDHGYVAPQVDETPRQYRIRQFDPGYCEYRVAPFGASGISGVVETPKRRPPPAHVVREVEAEQVKRRRR